MLRTKKVNAMALVFGLALAGGAVAGPIIIAGTDADDHGSQVGGVNVNGWEFMQTAFQQLTTNITNNKTRVVCIGCNGSQAGAAFNATTTAALLPGFTSMSLTALIDITNFFNGTGAVNINNTGVFYMPTVASNVGGGITDQQLAIVNLNGSAINSYVTAGGGLFTQEEANSLIGYGWLQSLLPGFTVMGDNGGGVNNPNVLQLTAAGQAQFPGLTNTDISNATPWHAYFGGNLGALQTLIVGDGNGVGGFNDPVVIGGGFAAGGGSITVPEPDTLALVGLAALSMLLTRRRLKI